ncbi:MAG TPA: hypothetical protein DEV93_13745 [Chloroflexi bacterium]|nr:hypothetical protein [Chloroflexota bacterium]
MTRGRRAVWRRIYAADKLRCELRGQGSTPLERILIDRIVMCRLQVEIAERQYVGMMKGGVTLTKGRFYEDLQDRPIAVTFRQSKRSLRCADFSAPQSPN